MSARLLASKRWLKVIWAFVNLLLVSALIFFETGAVLPLALNALGSPHPQDALTAGGDLFLAILLVGPFVLPAAITGLVIATIDGFLLIRLAPHRREWRWPDYLFAASLAAGLVCGIIILKIMLGPR